MQIMIETLLCSQCSTVREVVVKLIIAKLFVDVLAAVRIFPLYIKQMSTMAGTFNPASGLSGTL